MSSKASGAEVVRLFDSRQSTHYATSEQTQFELAQIFRALEAIGDLADGQPGDQGADLEPHHYSPIFRSFSAYGPASRQPSRGRLRPPAQIRLISNLIAKKKHTSKNGVSGQFASLLEREGMRVAECVSITPRYNENDFTAFTKPGSQFSFVPLNRSKEFEPDAVLRVDMVGEGMHFAAPARGRMYWPLIWCNGPAHDRTDEHCLGFSVVLDASLKIYLPAFGYAYAFNSPLKESTVCVSIDGCCLHEAEDKRGQSCGGYSAANHRPTALPGILMNCRSLEHAIIVNHFTSRNDRGTCILRLPYQTADHNWCNLRNYNEG